MLSSSDVVSIELFRSDDGVENCQRFDAEALSSWELWSSSCVPLHIAIQIN